MQKWLPTIKKIILMSALSLTLISTAYADGKQDCISWTQPNSGFSTVHCDYFQGLGIDKNKGYWIKAEADGHKAIVCANDGNTNSIEQNRARVGNYSVNFSICQSKQATNCKLLTIDNFTIKQALGSNQYVAEPPVYGIIVKTIPTGYETCTPLSFH